jgi:protein-S-isoprenylcysteine O-methyltransferase Ste14
LQLLTDVHFATQRLVRRFSRRSYLAALWVNSLGLLITLIPAIALMSFVVIPREERYLEARFPSEYVPYKASVRRWL